MRCYLTTLVILLAFGEAASAQVKLELKWQENTKSTLTTTTKLHQILTINAMEIETGSEGSTVVSQILGTRRADGSLPRLQKIESLRAKVELPMGLGFSFDSAAPDVEKPANPEIAKLYDGIKAASALSFTEILDKDGKFVAVENKEKILNDLKDITPETKERIKLRLSDEVLKRANDQELAIYPAGEVKKGDTWERTEVMDLGSGQLLTFKKRYEYLGTENVEGMNLDKLGVTAIEVVLTMDADPKSPIKISASSLQIDSSVGSLYFNRAQGQVARRQSKTRIKGDLTLEAGGNLIPATLDLTIEADLKEKVAAVQ